VVDVSWSVLEIERPVLDSLRLSAVAIALAASYLLFWRKWSVLRTLGVCALLGLLTAL
jgi:chromate transporter